MTTSTTTTTSSWSPVDLGPYVRGEQVHEPPVLVERSDGRAILYPRRLTWLSGPPESVKTWFALIACIEAMTMAQNVVYIDFEGDPAEIVERLRALGASDAMILDLFHYIRPYDPLTAQTAKLVLAIAEASHPFVSIIDGVNDAMGASGLDFKDSTDFYKWWGMFGDKLFNLTSGPTMAIDHVVKDTEQRKQYASGTGQKLAKVDVHLGFDVVKDFGRGLTGLAEIHLHKDRAGHLRAIAEKKLLGKLVLTSHPDGHITWEIDPPAQRIDTQGEPITFRPTVLMERISRHMEKIQAPQTQRSIREQVPGDNNAMKTAIAILAEEGYLVGDMTKTYPTYRSIKPYRERSESGLKAVWTDRGDGSGLRSVSPVRGQTGTDHDQAAQTTQSGLPSESDGCPACSKVDYIPLDGGKRRCIACQEVWNFTFVGDIAVQNN